MDHSHLKKRIERLFSNNTDFWHDIDMYFTSIDFERIFSSLNWFHHKLQFEYKLILLIVKYFLKKNR